MDETLKQRLDAQDKKLDAIFKSVEKTRKYFLVIIWITVAAIVVPLIGLLFAIPAFISNYASTFSDLGF